jgi:putative ABC transport system substrate-binding protein
MLQKCLKLLLRAGLALSLLLWGTVYAAGRADVALVIDKTHPIYSELLESLERHLAQDPDARPAISVIALSATPASKFFNASQKLPDLIVTVGTVAATQVAELGLPTPLLCVLIPKISFEEIKRQKNRGDTQAAPARISAIYLDQPLERQFDLIRLVLPKARHVSVLLGPDTRGYEQELLAIAAPRKLQVHVRNVTENENPVTALDRLLNESDVMLGIVDPLVFNHANAQNILLTTYHHRVPLIGISPGYVKAGALAAVHSTPAEIGRQLAEILPFITGKSAIRLPAPQYPKYFSVSVNSHVAQSLGIVLDDEETLVHKLTIQK